MDIAAAMKWGYLPSPRPSKNSPAGFLQARFLCARPGLKPINNLIRSHRWRLRRANSNHIPDGTLHFLPPYSPELNPQENLWDEIREKIFKNYALKSMDEVCDKLVEAALYIERNPEIVKSITSFPYIVKSL